MNYNQRLNFYLGTHKNIPHQKMNEFNISDLTSNKNKYDNLIVKYDTHRVNVKIVREANVYEWPGVKSGWLSKEDALEMFCRYFVNY